MQTLHNATQEFYEQINSPASPYFVPVKVPVGIKEVKDHSGSCFNLVTEEIASLDTTVQGIDKING